MRNTSKSCSITRAASVVILFSSDSPKAPTASLHKRGRTRSSIRATLAFEREAFVRSSDGTESKAVVLILPPRPANPLPAHKRHRRRRPVLTGSPATRIYHICRTCETRKDACGLGRALQPRRKGMLLLVSRPDHLRSGVSLPNVVKSRCRLGGEIDARSKSARP